MPKGKWLYALVGWLVGSFFGLQALLGMFRGGVSARASAGVA